LEEFYFTENFTGFNLFYSPECLSTGPLAREAAKISGPNTPVALYTFHQTAGRGQGNHYWDSEPGRNLAVTYLIQNSEALSLYPVVFNKCIALGVRHTLRKLSAMPVKIKWPNDMYHEGNKISGLLLESFLLEGQQRMFSAGIGINVNQEIFPDGYKASSLKNITGEDFNIAKVLHELTYNISHYINKLRIYKIEEIDEEFNENLWCRNELIQVILRDNSTQQGVLRYVDDAGRIVLENENGQRVAYHHGEAIIDKNFSIK
jgi:BirA family biotin operon repressor/biotin-[acetyl-CoA-carboxylase] ligase